MRWQASGSRVWICAVDFFAVGAAWLLAYWFRFNLYAVPPSFLRTALQLLPIVLAAQVIPYFWFRVQRSEWRYTSIPDVLRLVKTAVLGAILGFVAVYFLTFLKGVPRSVFPLHGMFVVLSWTTTRFLYRQVYLRSSQAPHAKRVIIVGAGQAGEHLLRDLWQNRNDYLPVGFVDDDRRKQGVLIRGLRVLGRCRDLPNLASKKNIDLIFIAIPSAESKTMRRIVRYCQRAGVSYRTLPGLVDLAEGRVALNALRQVELEDLLGRDPVELDWHHVHAELDDRVVLVTGGGGSIGSELCRQIARLRPRRLVVLENSEFNLFRLEQEFTHRFPDIQLGVHLGDVSDRPFVRSILQAEQPEYIFHAAAYKHVPMLESQIRSAMRNNVLGTRVIAEEAVYAKARAFVLISSDKAVNPTNIMGATKRIAERFCQNFRVGSGTRFITVRFGNVLGSAGSVVPIFKEQIARGGPVTVTDPEATRLFMTIPEASQLILQAMVQGEGSEIFVLDMGEPVQISYLAEQLIRLTGLEPHKDIDIVYTGLRPGEKLHEQVFHHEERLELTEHRKILKAYSSPCSFTWLQERLDQVNEACTLMDDVRLMELLMELVPEYSSGAQTYSFKSLDIPSLAVH